LAQGIGVSDLSSKINQQNAIKELMTYLTSKGKKYPEVSDLG